MDDACVLFRKCEREFLKLLFSIFQTRKTSDITAGKKLTILSSRVRFIKHMKLPITKSYTSETITTILAIDQKGRIATLFRIMRERNTVAFLQVRRFVTSFAIYKKNIINAFTYVSAVVSVETVLCLEPNGVVAVLGKTGLGIWTTDRVEMNKIETRNGI